MKKNAKRTNLDYLQEKQIIGIHVISIIALLENSVGGGGGGKYPLTFSYKQQI